MTCIEDSARGLIRQLRMLEGTGMVRPDYEVRRPQAVEPAQARPSDQDQDREDSGADRGPRRATRSGWMKSAPAGSRRDSARARRACSVPASVNGLDAEGSGLAQGAQARGDLADRFRVRRRRRLCDATRVGGARASKIAARLRALRQALLGVGRSPRPGPSKPSAPWPIAARAGGALHPSAARRPPGTAVSPGSSRSWS